jgi:hypothetical protein
MRTIGVIGGIAPESTIEYYRGLVTAYRAQVRDGSYPSIVINSIDMKKMLDLIGSNALADCTEFLLEEVQRLADARADLALLASNTPHVVFDDLRRRSPIPLVSIVEAACEATKALGLTKVGLFGTRWQLARMKPDTSRPSRWRCARQLWTWSKPCSRRRAGSGLAGVRPLARRDHAAELRALPREGIGEMKRHAA